MTDLRRDLVQGRGHPAAAGRAPTTRPGVPADRARSPASTTTSGAPGTATCPPTTCRRPRCPASQGVSASRAAHGATDYDVTVSDPILLDLAAHPGTDQPDRGAGRLALRHRRRWTSSPASDGLDARPACSYSMTGVNLAYSAADLARAPSPVGLGEQGLHPAAARASPRIVRTLANEVTRRRADPLREGGRPAAVVPQDRRVHLRHATSPPATAPTTWSRSSATATAAARGYCEQFASAMAVMARMLGIPAPGRGRLPRAGRRSAPARGSTARTTCTPGPSCSSPAPGWVRFEPTPAGAGRRARLHHPAGPGRQPHRAARRPR